MADRIPTGRTYSFTTACCWLVIFAIVGFIFVRNTVNALGAADRPLTSVVPAPDVSLEITSRMLLGQANLITRLPGGADPALVSRQRKRMIAAIDAAAITPADKLNAIPVIAELSGADEAIDRLDRLQGRLAPNRELAGDADVLRGIYMRGIETVTASQREGLLQRHQWFGQLALVFGLPPQDAQRQAVVETAVRTTIVLGIVFVAGLVVVAAGLALLIVGIVFVKKGRLRAAYPPSLPLGPPVFLETFALWLCVWLVGSLMLRLLRWQSEILTSELIVSVFSLGVALWPLWRGSRWAQLRAELGWHVGRGLPREIFAGVIGYIAGLPIMGIGFVISAILVRESGSHPTHPILRELGHDASALSLVGIYVAACLLAPLIEETMFRGALYSHLRRRHRPVFAALGSAVVFAAIHPQGWAAIPVLGSIGFVLAMLREWRGSLAASMTAHAMNNAAALTFVILLLRG